MGAIYEARGQLYKSQCFFRLFLREKRNLKKEEEGLEGDFQDEVNPIKSLRCYR